jgi:hypothetical protein
MRQDKTFTRILLIFSIASVVLAGPAVVRQRRLVTDRSGSDASSDDGSTDGSRPLLDKVIDSYSTSQSPATLGSVAQAPPPSPAGPGSLDQDSAPGSGTSELHHVPPPYVPPFTSGNRDPPSQPNAPPEVEMQPLGGNQPPASESGDESLPDDAHPSWHYYSPNTEIEEVGESEPDVHNVPDVNKEDDHYYDIDLMKQFLDHEDDEVKPKTFCGVTSHCWNVFSNLPSFWDPSGWQHLPRSFEWSPERDHGHRFS